MPKITNLVDRITIQTPDITQRIKVIENLDAKLENIKNKPNASTTKKFLVELIQQEFVISLSAAENDEDICPTIDKNTNPQLRNLFECENEQQDEQEDEQEDDDNEDDAQDENEGTYVAPEIYYNKWFENRAEVYIPVDAWTSYTLWIFALQTSERSTLDSVSFAIQWSINKNDLANITLKTLYWDTIVWECRLNTNRECIVQTNLSFPKNTNVDVYLDADIKESAASKTIETSIQKVRFEDVATNNDFEKNIRKPLAYNKLNVLPVSSDVPVEPEQTLRVIENNVPQISVKKSTYNTTKWIMIYWAELRPDIVSNNTIALKDIRFDLTTDLNLDYLVVAQVDIAEKWDIYCERPIYSEARSVNTKKLFIGKNVLLENRTSKQICLFVRLNQDVFSQSVDSYIQAKWDINSDIAVIKNDWSSVSINENIQSKSQSVTIKKTEVAVNKELTLDIIWNNLWSQRDIVEWQWEREVLYIWEMTFEHNNVLFDNAYFLWDMSFDFKRIENWDISKVKDIQLAIWINRDACTNTYVVDWRIMNNQAMRFMFEDFNAYQFKFYKIYVCVSAIIEEWYTIQWDQSELWVELNKEKTSMYIELNQSIVELNEQIEERPAMRLVRKPKDDEICKNELSTQQKDNYTFARHDGFYSLNWVYNPCQKWSWVGMYINTRQNTAWWVKITFTLPINNYTFTYIVPEAWIDAISLQEELYTLLSSTPEVTQYYNVWKSLSIVENRDNNNHLRVRLQSKNNDTTGQYAVRLSRWVWTYPNSMVQFQTHVASIRQN